MSITWNSTKSSRHGKKKYLKKRYGKKKNYVKILNKAQGLSIKRINKKRLKTIRKILKYTLKKKVETVLSTKNLVSKRINIKITQNNIFCTLVDHKRNRILQAGSSGIYKIVLSKRSIRNNFKAFIKTFFRKISNYCKNFNNTLFNLVAPKRIRKELCKIIKREIKKKNIRKKNIIINITPKRSFNGCRAKKGCRKKRKLYRIYK